MNLFDFLKKFGSRLEYFVVYIKFKDNHNFTLKLFSNGMVSMYPTVNYTMEDNFDAYLKNDKYLNIYFNKKFYEFMIPFSFDYFVPNDKFSLYIPESKENIELYNKLVRRRDVYLDSRNPEKSVWRHFKRINK